MKKAFPHILQTPEWGKAKSKAIPSWHYFFFVKYKAGADFQQADSIDDWSKVFCSLLILERRLGLGQRLHYIPRGPYVDWQDESAVKHVLEYIKSFAWKRRALFTRLEPDVYESDFPYKILENMAFRKSTDYIQACDTVKINLQMSEEELLASFHKKHRYNIRLANRRGLSVRCSRHVNDVKTFYDLALRTEQRHKGALNLHPLKYYELIFAELVKANMARLYFVEKKQKPISASLVFSFGHEVIYMFGASDYQYRRDMPNHLREWQSMLDAKKEGREYFDLWGVTMRNDPGGGIKRYKLGYYNVARKMAGTFDWAPLWIKYNIFNLLNNIRRNFGFKKSGTPYHNK